MESLINRSIDRMIWGGTFLFGRWQNSGPIPVLEDGVVTTWHGIAFETRYADVALPGPCRPAGSVSLYLWRPLADSTGIDAIFAAMEIATSLDDAVLGMRESCPAGGRHVAGGHQPHVGRFVVRGGPASDGYEAVTGQVHMQAVGAGSAGPPCRLASGRLFDDRCEEISVGVTVHATFRPAPAPGDSQPGLTRELSIGPGVVPGLRFFDSCHVRMVLLCSDTSVRTRAESLVLAAEPSAGIQQSRKYRAVWQGDTVLRTVVQLRFRPAAPDSLVRTQLAWLGALIEARGPAGSFYLRVPDPGPGPGAFDRLIERLRRLSEVESVYPLRPSNLPTGLPGRVEVRLHGEGGQVAADGLVCYGWRPGPWNVATPACGKPTAGGTVRFDSVPAIDAFFYAGCLPREGNAVVSDSVAIRVEPGRTATARLRANRCPER